MVFLCIILTFMEQYIDIIFKSNCTGFEVNFMDDVGQTLLNWASAFGTQEMVRRFYSLGSCLHSK